MLDDDAAEVVARIIDRDLPSAFFIAAPVDRRSPL